MILPSSGGQDSQFVTPIGGNRPLLRETTKTNTIQSTIEDKFPPLTQSKSKSPVTTANVYQQISAQEKKKNNFSTYHHLNEQSETDAISSQAHMEIALCLNWIDECIVTAIMFLFISFSIYYVIEL